MDILTTAANEYMTTFSGFVGQFLGWGQWIFFSLLTINLVWLVAWYAFDKASFVEGMSSFIKKFFVISLFYTIMLNHDWLLQLLQTAQVMGSSLTHAPIDPSSILSQGLGVANKIVIPIAKSSILRIGFGALVVFVVYLFILYVFINIALDLAVTLITTTALITAATFFLGFAALGATSAIARQTLDIILGNCIKLLGIYMVVAAGSQTIVNVANTIPTSLVSFDPYAWIAAIVGLFWLLAKNLPQQLARIVHGAIHDNQHTDAAVLALAAIRTSQTLLPAAKAGASVVEGATRLAGSTLYNASAHASTSKFGLAGAAVNTTKDLAHAIGGNIADRFRHTAQRLSGGGSGASVKSVASRMHSAAQTASQQAASPISDATQNTKPNTSTTPSASATKQSQNKGAAFKPGAAGKRYHSTKHSNQGDQP